MDRIIIQGGVPLQGRIQVSGAKNAALPLMAATLLTDQAIELSNVPDVADVATMQRLLQRLGTGSTMQPGAPGTLQLQTSSLMSTTAPYDLVRKMRASVLVLGPMLARQGEATVSLPGGCAIGTRPIDLHLMGLERMGAVIELEQGYVKATAPKGLKGAEIKLPQPSVGATENILMAASLADGDTVILDAAQEPEIVDLAALLTAMGAEIEGAGTGVLRVRGRSSLGGASHRIIADRIEAGTYAMAAGITAGHLHLEGVKSEHLGVAAERLEEAGLVLEDVAEGLSVKVAEGGLKGVDVMTRPFPGFATDLQAQFMALMCMANGASMITETIFENRFMHVPELARMGARITVHGGSALVRGQSRLTGAPVMATDLRASVSLVLAGLAAEGPTTVNRVYHLDRGYERLEEKLRGVGARIERAG
ncbi:MAG TPA: UDP-N-acetylglucosamine 1-carboxyvinyltransferase [Geminicoccus sp.]|jgi:UDP-N-acetylglucosamine 1-carboxyvinyltransferase|uniref:UDP-N-acetylglucosamine 1-carboxyvinyltransferase n=1 Tax=Geminicoccus sp. TaxID=2024832 RepID=UPI002E32FB3F|nr:UDP-N-acetylglucosamine 1-carboxyvinyltransferase [Geminicoccus sp.]HEX2527458.1 UDP-N-acetylglucosamine 1-carboxyvinyltransferase [Geminicoccus sp.]